MYDTSDQPDICQRVDTRERQWLLGIIKTFVKRTTSVIATTPPPQDIKTIFTHTKHLYDGRDAIKTNIHLIHFVLFLKNPPSAESGIISQTMNTYTILSKQAKKVYFWHIKHAWFQPPHGQ